MLCVLHHATALLSCEKLFNISVKSSTIRSRAPPPSRPNCPNVDPLAPLSCVFCGYGAHTIQSNLFHGQHARWRDCMLTKPPGVTLLSHRQCATVALLRHAECAVIGDTWCPDIWDNSRHPRGLLRLLRGAHDPHRPLASPTREAARLFAWKLHSGLWRPMRVRGRGRGRARRGDQSNMS